MWNLPKFLSVARQRQKIKLRSRSQSEGNRIHKKNKTTSVKHEHLRIFLFFSHPGLQAQQKIIPNRPIQAEKFQIRGRRPRCPVYVSHPGWCLKITATTVGHPPPSVCSGIKANSNPRAPIEKTIKVLVFFKPGASRSNNKIFSCWLLCWIRRLLGILRVSQFAARRDAAGKKLF